jgi:thioredoxin 2
MSPSVPDDRGIVTACPNCGQQVRTAYERLGQTVRCPRCKQEVPPPAEPIEMDTVERFEALTTRSPLPVVVDFWAPWCGPCHMVAPEIKKVAASSAGRWVVAKVNTEALPDLAAQAGVQSIPMMAVFAGGRERSRTVGARPAAGIELFVRQALGTAR